MLLQAAPPEAGLTRTARNAINDEVIIHGTSQQGRLWRERPFFCNLRECIYSLVLLPTQKKKKKISSPAVASVLQKPNITRGRPAAALTITLTAHTNDKIYGIFNIYRIFSSKLVLKWHHCRIIQQNSKSYKAIWTGPQWDAGFCSLFLAIRVKVKLKNGESRMFQFKNGTFYPLSLLSDPFSAIPSKVHV